MKPAKCMTAMFAVASLLLGTTTFAVAQSEKQDRSTTQRDKEVERSTTGSQRSQATFQGIVRSSRLIGADVQSPQGEDLGNIEEIAIDAQTGDVAYAVLSFGGFLGLGEKYFAIPWKSFTQRPGEEETLVLNVDKERLQQATGFDKNNWPDMADRKWGEEIHAFYGQEPYWGRQAARQQDDERRMTQEGTSTRSQQQENVSTVQEIDQSSGNVTLRTSEGDTIDMQVSDQMASKLNTGDRVKLELRKRQQGQKSQSDQSAGMQSQAQRQARSGQQEETVNTTVQKVDQSRGRLELQTAAGKTIELRAPEELISELKSGDVVEVVIRQEDQGQGQQSGQSSGKSSYQEGASGKQPHSTDRKQKSKP